VKDIAPGIRQSSERKKFWIGILFGGVLAIGLNLLPYLRTHGAYGTDGFEVIGFPFVFRSLGGFVGKLDFHWWALLVDVLLAALLAFTVGYLWSRIRMDSARKPSVEQ
jgi:hypothetical protein